MRTGIHAPRIHCEWSDVDPSTASLDAQSVAEVMCIGSRGSPVGFRSEASSRGEGAAFCNHPGAGAAVAGDESGGAMISASSWKEASRGSAVSS